MADTVTIKKITDLPENTDANDADLFMQGVNGTASLRKIKWSTILAKIKSKLLANNLTTTQEGYALDARQGKALSDQINALNTKTANLSGMSIAEIVSLFDTYGEAGIGYKSWNDDYATPDRNYSFILYTKGVAIAITYAGNIYHATVENPTWEAAG